MLNLRPNRRLRTEGAEEVIEKRIEPGAIAAEGVEDGAAVEPEDESRDGVHLFPGFRLLRCWSLG